MIKKKHPQINHPEETENVKWCVFKVPQYIFHTQLHINPTSFCLVTYCDKLGSLLCRSGIFCNFGKGP